jgi:hypothetical protein
MGLDIGWCANGVDVEETYPFPDWLWGSDLDYLFGLSTHLSWSCIDAARAQASSSALDGYHPYDDVFREHGAAESRP